MKRFLSVFLALIMIFSFCLTGYVKGMGTPDTALGERLVEYVAGRNNELLQGIDYYGYRVFVRDFEDNTLAMEILEIINNLIGTGSKPDKEKYMDVLINLMGTYDAENSADIAEQKKQDNLKGAQEYGEDFLDILKDSASLTFSTYPSIDEMDSFFSTAIEGIYTGKDNLENWVETFSDLETVIQNYGRYDEFLQAVEQNTTDSELKEACSTLRSSMKKATQLRLETYCDVGDENFKNWGEYFFSDAFFAAVKQMPEYSSDDAFRFFVDGGSNLISKVLTLNASWDLGKKIGTLVGNLTVGGENLINRVLEMMALNNIASALNSEAINTFKEFGENLGTDKEEALANQYITFLKQLAGCHIRGEYCLYSIISSDAGLLSWFNQKSAQKAEKWYQNQAKIISDADAVLDNMVVQANLEKKKQTENNDSYEEDRKTYTQYLINGGYNELMGYFDKNYIDINTCMIDIDFDKTYELLISLTNTEFPGPRGYEEITALLDIQDGNVQILIDAYYSGGTIGGDFLVLKYDTATNKHILALDGLIRDGVYRSSSYLNIFASNNIPNEINMKITIDVLYTSISDYAEEANNIRSETSLYYEEGNIFRYYKINGNYVKETEYDSIRNRFIDPTDEAYSLKSGSYDVPIP